MWASSKTEKITFYRPNPNLDTDHVPELLDTVISLLSQSVIPEVMSNGQLYACG